MPVSCACTAVHRCRALSGDSGSWKTMGTDGTAWPVEKLSLQEKETRIRDADEESWKFDFFVLICFHLCFRTMAPTES